jgi:hypothetical protein
MLLVMVKQLALKLRWNEILAKLDIKNYNTPHFQAHKPALYGRKVFLGGLPAGITTGINIGGLLFFFNSANLAELQANFCRFGSVVVDWPNKALFESMPPRGNYRVFKKLPFDHFLVKIFFFPKDSGIFLCEK